MPAETPFFSVIIPTKNRPKFLRDAILSVIWQDFTDYELIISDNSTNNASQEVVTEFVQYKQVKYFHPLMKMSMPTHFEWATKQASGKYCILLTDRSVLIQGALRKLFYTLQEYNNIQLISYPWFIFDEKRGIFCGSKIPKIDSGIRKSSKIISIFLENPENLYNMPRDLNSCYSKEIAKQIRDKFGAVFMPINPDFTFAFLMLSQLNEILFMDTPLFISQGLDVSTANTFDAYLDSLDISNLFKYTPLKIPLFMNTVFNDFLRIQELADKNLSPFKINWVVYFNVCYRELLRKRHLINKKEFQSILNNFDKVLKDTNENIQNKVKQQIAREIIPTQIRFLLHKYKLDECVRGIKRRIDFIQIQGLRQKYESVLKAAGFEYKKSSGLQKLKC